MTLTLTPEQEAVLERSVRSGRFSSRDETVKAAFDSLDSEASLPEDERARLANLRSKSLIELFRESPFAGLDIEFPRDPAPMRDVDF